MIKLAGVYRPKTKNAFLITLEGVDYIFTKMSGLGVTREVSNYPSGTGADMFSVAGSRKIEPVTLEGHLDINASKRLEEFYSSYDDRYLTISVQPINPFTQEADGNPYVLSGCLLVEYKIVEVDQSSAEVVPIALKFTVDSWSRS